MKRNKLLQAKKAFQENRFSDSLKLSQDIIETDPMNISALICLAKSSYNENQLELSVGCYNKLAELQPELALVWKGLLDAYSKMGKENEMIIPLEHLASIALKNGKKRKYQNFTIDLAKLYYHLGKVDMAIICWSNLYENSWAMSAFGEADETSITDVVSPVYACINILKGCQILFESPVSILEESNKAKRIIHDTYINLRRLLKNPLYECSNEETHSDVVDAVNDYFAFSMYEAQSSKTTTLSIPELYALSKQAIEDFPDAFKPVEVFLILHESTDYGYCNESVESAIKILSRMRPSSGVLMVANGLRKKEIGLFDDALTMLLQGTQKYKNSWVAWIEMADIVLRSGPSYSLKDASTFHDFAKKSYTECLNSRQVHTYFERKVGLVNIRMLLQSGQRDAALVKLEDLYRENRASVRISILLAEEYLLRGDFCLAEKVMCDFADCETSNADVALCFSRIYYAKENFAEAESRLSALIRICPINADAFHLLGMVYWKLGGEYFIDKNYCIKHLLHSAKLNPWNHQVFGQIGTWYLLNSDPIRAEKCFKKSLSINPRDDKVGTALSNLFIKQKRFKDLVDYLNGQTMKYRKIKWMWEYLSQAYLHLDSIKCIDCMHEVLRQNPLNVLYWISLGHAYQYFGRHIAALKAYQKAIDLGSTHWVLYCEMARVEIDLGLFNEAHQHLDTVINDEACSFVVYVLYTQLVYEESKTLGLYGMYGKAAKGILRGVELVELGLGRSPADFHCLWKLQGDLYTYAVFLSPITFNNEKLFALNEEETLNNWSSFIAKGFDCYDKMLNLLTDSKSKSMGYYDLGTNIYYQLRTNRYCRTLLIEAKTLVRNALKEFPDNGCLWNLLGCIEDSYICKNYSFVRSIELQGGDTSWSNFGINCLNMGIKDLSREAFLHLQSVNPHIASVWLGLGLVKEASGACDMDTKASYICAVEQNLHMDALIGIALSCSRLKSDFEAGLFAIRKVLELDPFNIAAMNIQGVILMNMGLAKIASAIFLRAIDLLNIDVPLCGPLDKEILESNLFISLTLSKEFQKAKALYGLLSKNLDHELAMVFVHLFLSDISNAMKAINNLLKGDFECSEDLNTSLEHLILRISFSSRKMEPLDLMSPVKSTCLIGVIKCLKNHPNWIIHIDDKISKSSQELKFSGFKNLEQLKMTCLEYRGETSLLKTICCKYLHKDCSNNIWNILSSILWRLDTPIGSRVADCSIQGVLKRRSTKASMELKYRLKGIMLAFFSGNRSLVDVLSFTREAMKYVRMNSLDHYGWLYLFCGVWLRMSIFEEEWNPSSFDQCIRIIESAMKIQEPHTEVYNLFLSLRVFVCSAVKANAVAISNVEFDISVPCMNVSISTYRELSTGDSLKKYVEEANQQSVEMLIEIAAAYEAKRFYQSAFSTWKYALRISRTENQKIYLNLRLAQLSSRLNNAKDVKNRVRMIKNVMNSTSITQFISCLGKSICL